MNRWNVDARLSKSRPAVVLSPPTTEDSLMLSLACRTGECSRCQEHGKGGKLFCEHNCYHIRKGVLGP